MDGMIWLLLVQIVAIGVLGAVVVGLRRAKLGAERNARHCPHCETPMSMRRVSWFRSFIFLAAWQCQHCGNRSRPRRRMTGTAT
jgi:hypothetical protein